MSITMYNEINYICVPCEAIICSEQEESYITLIQFVLKTSTKRTNENIHMIAADGIINQDCVTNKELVLIVMNKHLMWIKIVLHA